MEKSRKSFPLVRIRARDFQAEKMYQQKRRVPEGFLLCALSFVRLELKREPRGNAGKFRGPLTRSTAWECCPEVQVGRVTGSREAQGLTEPASLSRVLGLGETLGPPVHRRRGVGPVLQLPKPTPDFLGPWHL